MKTYTVRWVIQVDADSPEAAAREALSVQRDPASIATVFDVQPIGKGVDISANVRVDVLGITNATK